MPEPVEAAAVIRPVGAEAAAAIARLHEAVFDDAWSLDSIERLLRAPTTAALVADLPETLNPVGFIMLQIVLDEAEVLSIGVCRERQRTGLGRRLAEAAIELARRRGVRRLLLEVAADNSAALSFYGGLGWREMNRRRGYYARAGGPAVDALVMDRLL